MSQAVKPRTLGNHLAARLIEIGIQDYFCVPGDFTLVLLDQLNAQPGLRMINCSNELNAGYAADGYARAKGVGAMVVTFTVGGLSAINAVAGAYAERVPLICITGAPNSNDWATTRTLHHTTADSEFGQEMRCYREVTCCQVTVRTVEDAYAQIDLAVSEALRWSKPVLIQVACNLASETHALFERQPVPYSMHSKTTNKESLEAAVEAAAELLNDAAKPVLVAGPRLRQCHARDAFHRLAEAAQYPIAVQPNAKGIVNEELPQCIGVYWAQVSQPFVQEIVESADAYLFAGPIFNDYNTVAFSSLISAAKMIRVEEERVTVAGCRTFGCVKMADFLSALAEKVKPNTTALENYKRMYVGECPPPSDHTDEPLKRVQLYQHIQELLDGSMSVVVETGDAMFNAMKLRLPAGCGMEAQMQYGSIGWSVGATLGQQAALQRDGRRALALIGDGSFQVTAQDVGTMIRFGYHPIIILINNDGYTIEEEIHSGPYNKIQRWDYAGVVRAFANGAEGVFAAQCRSEPQLLEALAQVKGEHAKSLCFLEVFLHPEDCSKELLEWGARLAAYNSRKPVAS